MSRLAERQINVPWDSELELILTKLKKADLQKITGSHGLTRTASLTKTRLNQRIMDALKNPERLEYILFGMNDLMLSDFMMLASEAYVREEALMSQVAGPLLDLGYIYAVMHESTPVLVMPDIVKEAYASINQEEFSEAKARFDLMYHYMRGAVSLYGICDFPQLVKLFNSHQDFEITAEEALNVLICKMTFHSDVQSYGPLLVDEALLLEDSDEEVKILAKLQDGKSYYSPSKDEIMQYGSDNGVVPVQLEALADLLSGTDSRAIIEDIAAAFCYRFTPKNALFALEMRGQVLPNFETSQQFFGIVQDAYNHARIWEHRGHTPNELEGNQPKKPVVVPTTAPLSVEKIGRNDPCPCGSQKKYKKCCQ